MKEKKKNTDSLENLKRQFLRLQSPSAFGSLRRFDSAAFMNVPPEMARRDAAYFEIEKRFYAAPFDPSCGNRRKLYTHIISRLEMIVEKTEFIHLSDSSEKRHLEGEEILHFVRLVLKYFIILDEMADSQTSGDRGKLTPQDIFFEQKPPSEAFLSLERNFHDSEENLFQAVKDTLRSAQPHLLALQEQRRRQFSKSDSERYERAYAIYLQYYSDLKTE